MGRVVFNVILISVFVYAVVVLGLYVFQRSLLYHPGHMNLTPAEAGVPGMRPIHLVAADGVGTVSWYQEAEGQNPTIVYFQGNAGAIADRVSKIQPYLDRGLGVLLVGYRGYGGNEGQPTENGLYADGAAALAFLEREGHSPASWILYGESLGSGVAVELARRHAVLRAVVRQIS